MFNYGALKKSGPVSVRYKVRLKLRFDTITSKAWMAKERNLRRAGALVRGIMRRLIRRRKNPNLASPVGSPPYAHFYPGIKNTIEFAVHKNRVIVGPQRLNKPNISPVPGALEHGGRTLVRVRVGVTQKGKKKKKKTNTPKKPIPPWLLKKIIANKAKTKVIRVPADIRPRPFARPALNIFKSQYPDIWRNCIK
jgi:hypothetical protein